MLLHPHNALVQKCNALALMRSQFIGDNRIDNYRNNSGIPDRIQNQFALYSQAYHEITCFLLKRR